jgi:hypothetical protein
LFLSFAISCRRIRERITLRYFSYLSISSGGEYADDTFARLNLSANGTFVTPLELPYEKTVYEGPVYPGTLTYLRTVPNIEQVRIGIGTAIRRGSLEIPG